MAEKISKTGTFINGIAASQHLDSSGEVLSIEGLDISSLEAGHGTFNWEHKNENSSQTVGKVLKAKKIFSEEDCEDETQLHFWGICKSPFLYVMGELFDAVGHEQAKEVAAMLRYDAQKRIDNADYKNVISFSIEGGKIEKKGNEITRSIARKVTLTISACNKMALAEQYVPTMDKKDKSTNLLDNLFKTENFEPIEIINKNIYDFPPNPIGNTTSGKKVYSNVKPIDYKNFTSQDHHDAMNAHYKMVEQMPTHEMKQHHFDMAKMHMNARNIAENKEKRFATGKKQLSDKALSYGKVTKSQDVAPSQLTGYAALQREDLVRDIKKQAEDAFKRVKDKKALVKTIMDKNPNLFKHQAETLAKMAAYKNMQKAEKSLETLLEKMSRPKIQFPEMGVPTRLDQEIRPIGTEQQKEMHARAVVNAGFHDFFNRRGISDKQTRQDIVSQRSKPEVASAKRSYAHQMGNVMSTSHGGKQGKQFGSTLVGKQYSKFDPAAREVAQEKDKQKKQEWENKHNKWKEELGTKPEGSTDYWNHLAERPKMPKKTAAPKMSTEKLSPEAQIARGKTQDMITEHEAAHLAFGHLRSKDPYQYRQVMNHLLESFSPDVKSALISSTARRYNPKSPHFAEEVINNARDILVDKRQRSNFLSDIKMGAHHGPSEPEVVTKLKSQWKELTNRAKKIKPNFGKV